MAAWLAGFFLVALGAKLWTIQLWTTNVLYWDQWDEMMLFFRPWLEGHLTWDAFILPHNEHRIFFTRLLDLLEVKFNGQWDIYLQTVVNAVIHISYGCGLVVVIWQFSGRKYSGLISLMVLPFFSLPFAMENTIHGFQSQVYLLGVFSLVVILGLGFGKPPGIVWLGGLIMAWLSIGTMASGFFATAAVFGLLGLRVFCGRKISQWEVFASVCYLGVIAYSLIIHVSPSWQKKYIAKTASDFVGALVANLQWPFHGLPIMAGFVCLPLVFLGGCLIKNRIKNRRAAEFVLTFGLWGFLQSAALAYARAGMLDSRYLDTVSTMAMASVAALFILTANFEFTSRACKYAPSLAIVWFVTLLGGLISDTWKVTDNYGPWIRSGFLVESEDVRAFIATDNPEWLKSKMSLEIPHSMVNLLLLRESKVLSILPAETRKPLKLEADESATSAFTTNAIPSGNPGRPFAKVWGDNGINAVAGSHFLSQPIFARLPKLSLQIYRGPVPDGVIIQFVEASGRHIELHPRFIDQWQTLVVDTPASPFRLEINNSNLGVPVAIGDIKELGRFSVLAENLVQRAAMPILWVGLSLCLILIILAMMRSKQLIGNSAPWLAALIIYLVTLIMIWQLRNSNGTAYAVSMHKELAAVYTKIQNPLRAKLHLQEALWLQPNDVDAQKKLAVLQSDSFSKTRPEEQESQ